MTEILTESFCERCGTRYTFEPVANRRKPLSAIGTLGRGIRHFVSDPGSTLDEAMAVARSESEQRSTASALEAFHRTFNFCLSCRQYTCGDCWNAVEGRCLSCAPTPDAAPPVTRVDTAVPLPRIDIAAPPAPLHVHDATAVAAETPPTEAGAVAEAAALADQAAIAEADARVAAQAAAAEAEAAAREAAAAEAATRAADELAARDAAAAAEAREAQEAAEAAARAAETAATEAEARRAAEAEAEAVAAALAEAEAAALAAAAEAEARAAADAQAREAAEAAEAALAAEAARAAEAESEATVAGPALGFEPGLNLDDEIAAYEREHQASPGAAALPEPQVAEPEPEPAMLDRAAASTEPIPTAIGQPIPASIVDGPMRWPEGQVAAAADLAWPNPPAPDPVEHEHVTASRGAGLPAADAAPVPPAARACPSCGLSLSASARFCRRCGTPQQVDAPH